MASFWQRVSGWAPPVVGAAGLGIAVLALLGAYALEAANSKVTIEGIAAALALAAIAATGLLYTWRLGAGGLVD